MRPIDGDRLMMHLTDWWYSSFGQSETDESKAIKTVLDKIEQSLGVFALEKQEADRWTPCKEKMPAKPFGCFVTVMDTNPITQEEFENILPYFVGWDGEQWNDADGEQIPCEVLAWRPLPAPYQEDES